MNTLTRIVTVVTLVYGTLSSVDHAGAAQDARDQPLDVGKALDQALPKLTIESKEIPEVLHCMTEKAGISITIDERSADLLPWGLQTRLKNVTIEGASLREALTTILGPLGMTYEMRDGGLVVVATQPLKRINRRATWEELKLLGHCNGLEYTPENFATLKLQYKITPKVDAPAMLQTQLAKAGRGTVAQILEVAAGALGWVWLPRGDHIVIKSSEAQVANYMSRRIDARYDCLPLARILVDLADKANTPINFESGMMLKLPPSTARGYTLLLQRTSIRQAFELVSAETGLEWDVRKNGIHVALANPSKVATGVASMLSRAPYVGRISVPSDDGSYTYDFLIRGDELPDDILEFRRQVIEEYIQKVRSDMSPDNAVRSP